MSPDHDNTSNETAQNSARENLEEITKVFNSSRRVVKRMSDDEHHVDNCSIIETQNSDHQIYKTVFVYEQILKSKMSNIMVKW